MIQMLGRNDPCLCGSGKKYKKCCALKNEPSTEKLAEEELERIIAGYYDQIVSDRKNISALEYRERQWAMRLSEMIEADDLQQAVFDYYVFVERLDLWNRYILKVLNGAVRSSTQKVLQGWREPIVLLGKVTQYGKAYVDVAETLGDKTYRLLLPTDFEIKENESVDTYVFGIVLPDTRTYDNGAMVLNGLNVISTKDDSFVKQVEKLAEESGKSSSYAFFKAHMLDVHEMIAAWYKFKDEVDANEKLDLPRQHQQVVDKIDETVEDLGLSEDAIEFMKNAALTYLYREDPGFRKPGVIAAAAFKVADEFDTLDEQFFSQAEIAALFDVSVSSFMKHVDKMGDVILNLLDEIDAQEQNSPEFSYSFGKDPRITEKFNWEMLCKSSRLGDLSMEDLQVMMNENMNEPFTPVNRQEEAQWLAYEAYDTEEEKERIALGKKAFSLDKENVDALLLKLETVSSLEKVEALYKQAIELGTHSFDTDVDQVWRLVTNRPYLRAIFSYGIWLYEQNRFKEAALQFEQLLELNPFDEQGVRYLVVAAHLHAGNKKRASALIQSHEGFSEEDAPSLYLEWLIARENPVKADALLEAAMQANPIVDRLMKEDGKMAPYPRQASAAPGSSNEALYIWYLIQPSV